MLYVILNFSNFGPTEDVIPNVNITELINCHKIKRVHLKFFLERTNSELIDIKY